MSAEGKDWDERIRAIIDPIESRMYAIQINHAEWLRENHQHLVMTGPGHDTYRAIHELATEAHRSGYLAALGDVQKLLLDEQTWSAHYNIYVVNYSAMVANIEDLIKSRAGGKSVENTNSREIEDIEKKGE